MILYHFTRPEYLGSILEHGLRRDHASGWSEDDCGNAYLAGGQPAVWFTEEDDNKPTLEYRRMMLTRFGRLAGPKYRHLCESTVCLRTVIPTHDRKLVKLARFWRGVELIHPKWWFYLGDIPPSRLTVHKHVPVGVPEWDIRPDNAPPNFILTFEPGLEEDLLAARKGPPEYIAAHMDEVQS
jgi:hypothetical protein